MSATRDFSRWAREAVNDPRYPAGMPKSEDAIALYVMLAEALEEAEEEGLLLGDAMPHCWMPAGAARPTTTN